MQNEKWGLSPGLGLVFLSRGCSLGWGAAPRCICQPPCSSFSQGSRCTDLCGHAKPIQGHEGAWPERYEGGGEGQHCSAKHRKRLACHMDGHWNGYRGTGRPWRPQVVTSQKETFTGTVRVWGCQTWHPPRDLSWAEMVSKDAGLIGDRQFRLLLLCVSERAAGSSSSSDARWHGAAIRLALPTPTLMRPGLYTLLCDIDPW